MLRRMLAFVGECKWSVVVSKETERKKGKKKIYAGSTQLLVVICMYCLLFKVNHVCCALAGLYNLYGD